MAVSYTHLAPQSLHRNYKDYELQISTLEKKVMAFHGTNPTGQKIVVDSTVLELVSNFVCLDYNVSYT